MCRWGPASAGDVLGRNIHRSGSRLRDHDIGHALAEGHATGEVAITGESFGLGPADGQLVTFGVDATGAILWQMNRGDGSALNDAGLKAQKLDWPIPMARRFRVPFGVDGTGGARRSRRSCLC